MSKLSDHKLNIKKLYKQNKTLVEELFIARGFWERFIGLMGKPSIKANQALYILKCNWIHTLFMKFSIDAVYINRHGAVVKIQKNIKPWRFCLPVFSANSVLELKADSKAAHSLNPGDVVHVGD